MKTKKFLKYTILLIVIIILAIAVAGFVYLDNNARNPYSEKMQQEFWADPGRYDVWFVGSSHVYYSIYPVKLYENYGIRSFCYTAPSSFVSVSYWDIKCALRKDKPKVIVMDTYHIQQEYPIINDETKIKDTLDGIPFSLTKLQAINALVPDYTFKKKLRLAFPFLGLYKNARDHVSYPPSEILGSKIKLARYDASNGKIADKDSVLEDTTGIMGYEYLLKTIELCKKENIQLVLTAWPTPGNELAQTGMNSARAIAAENDIPFVEPAYIDNFYDYSINFADENCHVNPAGAKRATAYMGEFLAKNYDVADAESSQDEQEYWDMADMRYRDYIKTRLNEIESLQAYLMILLDDKLEVRFYAEDGVKLPKACKLYHPYLNDLKKISKKDLKKYDVEPAKGNIVYVVRDKLTDEIISVKAFEI